MRLVWLLAVPLCSYSAFAHADERLASRQALDSCLMNSAAKYAERTCEDANTIYAASIGACAAERQNFLDKSFSKEAKQVIKYSERVSLVDEYINNQRAKLAGVVLELRIHLNKECN